MAHLFNAGETKIRPGIYYRYTGQNSSAAAALDVQRRGAVHGMVAAAAHSRGMADP